MIHWKHASLVPLMENKFSYSLQLLRLLDWHMLKSTIRPQVRQMW